MNNYGGKTFMIYKPNRKTVAEQRKEELLSAEVERLKAMLDYVAIMTDVEIFNEEEAANEIGNGESY